MVLYKIIRPLNTLTNVLLLPLSPPYKSTNKVEKHMAQYLVTTSQPSTSQHNSITMGHSYWHIYLHDEGDVMGNRKIAECDSNKQVCAQNAQNK